MKSVLLRLSMGVALVGSLSAVAFGAEEGMKALPTLLIKGEVVSLDTNDPNATLLKVKDRYGFETPIFVTQEAKVIQGDATLPLTKLAVGTPVEVEYNFDINTAKRHAVSVKVAKLAQAAAIPSAPVAMPAASSAAPMAVTTPVPAAAPVMPPATSEAMPVSAPSTPEAGTTPSNQ